MGRGLSSSFHVFYLIQMSVITTSVYRDLTSTLNHCPVTMFRPAEWEVFILGSTLLFSISIGPYSHTITPLSHQGGMPY